MSSPPDAPTSESLRAPESPYRGLTPYSEQDAPLFFGREAECDVVIDNMMASRLTLLYGASGVGKTSLLRAGVTHELLASSRRNIADYGSPEFVVVYFNRWSGDPVAALTRCIHESVVTVTGEQAGEPDITAAGLAETLQGWTTRLGSDLLIILDQFEEYFLYHPDDDGDGSFAVEFPRAVNRADLRVSFLIAIREDALAKLDRFKGHLPNLFDNYLRTRHLDIDAARAAIEKPLEAYNRLVSAKEPFRAESELVQAVLEQVQIGKVVLSGAGRGMVEPDTVEPRQRIETPYLQLVLTRLWREEVAADSHTLRAETLQRLGGAQQIVHTHLDEALGALPARQQDIAAGIFHHLVTPSGMKIAHTAPDLADYAQLPQSEVVSVLAELSRGDMRILRPIPPPSGQSDADPAYEIFHDVLAPAILDWWTRHTEARAAEARLAPRLERSAEQTRAAEERAHRYRQWLKRVSVIAMALLLALVSVVAVLAIRGRDAAIKAQSNSHSRELAARALEQVTIYPESSLGLALDALEVGSTPEAESSLRRALSELGRRVVFRGHSNWVMSAAVSPDGRSILTTSLDRTVRVWSAATGKQLAILRTGKPSYRLAGRPQFSRDGELILVTSSDGKVQVWPWRTGYQATVVSSGQDAYRAAISPDGNHIVTGHVDGKTRVWAWRTTRPPVVLPRSGKEKVTTVAFSAGDEFVATGGEMGTVRLWRWRKPGPPTLLAGHHEWVNKVAFSPDGQYLLTASDDGTARLFGVPDGRPVAVLRGNTDSVNSAAFSPDGNVVVTASDDGTARLFAVPDGRPVAVLRGATDQLVEAVFSPDGRLVATASPDGTAALWDAHSTRLLVKLRGHRGPLFTIAFSPDGKSVVTASADGTARLWEVPVQHVFLGHQGPLNGAVFSPDGSYVVTAGEDGTARLYEAASSRQIAVLVERNGVMDSAAFSLDGKRIVTAGRTAGGEGVTRVWEVAAPERGKVIARDSSYEIETAEFSRDGRLVLTSTQHEAVIRDSRTGQRRTTIRLAKEETKNNPFASILGASISPDGRWVLTTHYDKTARLWDSSTGKPVRLLRGHTGIVYTAAFSRDGTEVVTAGTDGTARVWDPATGQQMHVLVDPSGQLRSAAVSPDGRWVAGGAADGSVSVWDVSSEQLAAVLHQHTELVSTVAFSPDGKLILTASDDHTARAATCDSCLPLKELLAAALQRRQLTASGP
jgi:WD40 repeat protein